MDDTKDVPRIEELDESNYLAWCTQIECVLECKGVWETANDPLDRTGRSATRTRGPRVG
jgi:hypothetical protein